jgi:hypothetical protein
MKRFSDLPRQPLRRRIAGHRKQEQLPVGRLGDFRRKTLS